MSNWTDFFEPKRGQVPPPAAAPKILDDGAEVGGDARVYRPWLLQRGRGQPLLFLDLRRVEPKTGMAVGSQLAYPHLVAIEYFGDKMVSLDFGSRHFVIEGEGLQELVALLQQGTVMTIQEYSPKLWPERPQGAIVTRIVAMGGGAQEPTRD